MWAGHSPPRFLFLGDGFRIEGWRTPVARPGASRRFFMGCLLAGVIDATDLRGADGTGIRVGWYTNGWSVTTP